MTLLEAPERPVADTETEVDVDVTGMIRFGPCRALQHEFELFVPPEPKQVRELGSLVRPFRDREGRGEGVVRYVLSHPDADGISVFRRNGIRMSGGPLATRDFRVSLAWHINQSVIASSTDRYVLMHAAAVTRAGYTIIMPADMESGKTTTTAGLLREGFDYVTDEAVAIDPATLWVSPFPKTLSIDPGSWRLFPELGSRHTTRKVRQWHVPAADLGAGTAAAEVPAPSLVVIPKYVGGDVTEVVPLSDGEAVFELARMSFHFDRHPRRNLETLSRLVRRARVVRLRIATLDGAVEAVEELLSQRILEER